MLPFPSKSTVNFDAIRFVSAMLNEGPKPVLRRAVKDFVLLSVKHAEHRVKHILSLKKKR